jgi:hypothetical protein
MSEALKAVMFRLWPSKMCYCIVSQVVSNVSEAQHASILRE